MSCGSLNLAMIGPKGEKHSIDRLSVATEQEVLSASYFRSRRVVFSIVCRCLCKASDQCNTRPRAPESNSSPAACWRRYEGYYVKDRDRRARLSG
jgi:hypothetical protein